MLQSSMSVMPRQIKMWAESLKRVVQGGDVGKLTAPGPLADCYANGTIVPSTFDDGVSDATSLSRSLPHTV